MCGTDEKEIFYAKFDSVLDPCPHQDKIIVLGDFNAATGTERAGYELCVGSHGSGIRNTNSSLLLNFAKSRRLRIAGSWYQRPELHRWSWYSNAGGAAKEIDHILVSTCWRILQNCRVYGVPSSLQLTTGLLLQHSSFMSSPERYQDLITTCFILRNWRTWHLCMSMQWQSQIGSKCSAPLWDILKRKTFKAAKGWSGERPRSQDDFASLETLKSLEKNRAARLAGNRDQYKVLSHRTRTLLRESRRGMSEVSQRIWRSFKY